MVMVEGAPVSVTGTAIISQFVVLTLARAVTHRERDVTVSYNPPPPDNAVQSNLGRLAAALTDRAVNVIRPPSGPSIGGVHGKELFYAKMTVGDDRVNERAGYSTRLGIGSISVNPPEFDVGDDTYTVNHWVVGDSGTLHLILTGSLTQDAAANLALYAGNEKFRFADADRVADVDQLARVVWFEPVLGGGPGRSGADRGREPEAILQRPGRRRRKPVRVTRSSVGRGSSRPRSPPPTPTATRSPTPWKARTLTSSTSMR